MLMKRRSGLLLHIVSLPARYGIGDLGPAAYEFLDFLNRAGIGLWQILPLNPTDQATGNAPYSSISAFAGNPLLVSPEQLFSEGYLTHADMKEEFSGNRVDYRAVTLHRETILRRAYETFQKSKHSSRLGSDEFDVFVGDQDAWLHDYALFTAIKNSFGGKAWYDWPEDVRDRDPEALAKAAQDLEDMVRYTKFLQFLFFRQWKTLKKKCAENQVRILGDLPIYVSHDSSDVWANRNFFKLHDDGRKMVQAGVPPDYFSQTGQLWGNPVYRWDVLAESGYDWWLTRLEQSLKLYDLIRIDHFRGFAGYWEVDARYNTAVKGRWVNGPGEGFFHAVRKRFGELPLIAEDLGTITDDVRALMKKFSIPGTRVLLFSFGGDFPRNAYAPHNHIENTMVYTGTHDNNTVRGWLEEEASHDQKTQFFGYIGRRHDMGDAAWELVRLAFQSVAKVCMIPVQDVLGLGSDARMNRPATAQGNWTWRLLPGQLSDELARDLREMNWLTGRISETDA